MTTAPEPLGLQHAPRLQPLLAGLRQGLGARCLSEHSFHNLWLFRAAHNWHFVDGDWPHLLGHAYDGFQGVLPLFELADAPLDVCQALLHGRDGFFGLSDAAVQRLEPARWALHAPAGERDYLYRAADLAGFVGAGLHDKRNLVKQLLASHRVRVEPYTPALLPQALQVLQGWLADKGKQPGDADDTPARTALQHATDWGWCGQLLWADDTPAAWLLAEPLAPGLHVLRFAKSLARFKGVAAYGFSDHASRHAVQWLNFEQDLGLPNFRRTKASYRPAERLNKWRAVLQPTAASTP